jgi:hypothetical protein
VRRTLGLLVILALLLGACDEAERVVDEVTDSGNGGDGGGGGGDGTSGPGPGDGSTVDDAGPVGSAARVLLSSGVGGAQIEVDLSEGQSLSATAREALASNLVEHGSKSVSFTEDGTVESRAVYTAEDLAGLAAANRGTLSRDGTAGLYVMVLGGRFEDESAVGVAFSATAFAIFPERIRSALLAGAFYEGFETAVAVHELGHLFGLVNLTGKGAFHEDPQHPGHSNSDGSVMFWAVEDVSVGNVFRGGPPREFDEADRREMDAIRG